MINENKFISNLKESLEQLWKVILSLRSSTQDSLLYFTYYDNLNHVRKQIL